MSGLKSNSTSHQPGSWGVIVAHFGAYMWLTRGLPGSWGGHGLASVGFCAPSA